MISNVITKKELIGDSKASQNSVKLDINPSTISDNFKDKKNYGYTQLGTFYGCDPVLLDDVNALITILYDAAYFADMTPFGDLSKKFEPQGASGLVGLMESHISIHTWPEDGVAVVDVYTCGTKKSCQQAYSSLKQSLQPKKIKKQRLIKR